MPSPVHIAIHCKGDVSAFINVQDLHLLSVVQCPNVLHIASEQSVDLGQLVVIGVIGIQVPRLLKHHNIAILTLQVGHLLIPDTQQHLIVGIQFFHLRKLGHGSLIIQQVHSVRGIADPVVFFRMIDRVLLSPSSHQIMDGEGCRLP